MTIKEITEVLKSVGVPVAYHSFKSRTTPPFIAYSTYTSTYSADGKIVRKVHSVVVELYTLSFQSAEQIKLEKVLQDNKIVWSDCSTLYIESERIYEIIYNFETEECL